MRNSFDQILRPKRGLVSPNGRKTRWLGVAAALRQGIESGRFVPDEALPSTRELARSFDVHRHTALLALDALTAEGLLRSEPRRGFYVCAPVAQLARSQAKVRAARFPGFRLVRGGADAGFYAAPTVAIALHAAVPDAALLPMSELRAAYAHVLAKRGRAALAGVDERGLPGLRRELARYVRRARGFVPRALLVTHGSQEAIALAAQVLVRPGDTVLVEDPGYPNAARVFREMGAEVVPLPVDAQGLRVDALAKCLAQRTVRLLYTTPNHHYPTTVTLAAPRRAALLQLTRAHAVPVLEDDYDHEYHYRGVPQPPLAAAGDAPHVVYVGTLSKLVAPGIRVGFACGDPQLIDAMVRVRSLVTRSNDGVTQAALADWMSDGGLDRHLRRARRTYALRRDAAVAALARAAQEVSLEYTAPDGGLAIWTVWPEHDVLALATRAAAHGVSVLPEPLTRAQPQGHGMRLAFGAVTPAQFEQGLAVLLREAKAAKRE
jgi:GntR family transcriptional regulator/MocR family aminotransferase